MQGKYNVMDRVGAHIASVTKRRDAKQALFAVFSVIGVLIATALLAAPHAAQEPVEVNALTEPQPKADAVLSPQPSATPKPFVQHEEYLLVLVNADTEMPEDFPLATRAFDGVEVNTVMYAALCEMMDDARADGCRLWAASGYRSIAKQTEILERAVQNRINDGMSEEEARTDALLTIQKPGHSEHHTGLAVDFNDVSYAFEDSFEYAWLRENAAKYGFIERYPAEKAEITGIAYEPWHFRFVGEAHAQRMEKLGVCLEEYLSDIADE